MTIVYCKHCGNEYDALTEEVGSYICPICAKTKGKHKKLDSVRLKSLTEKGTLTEAQDPLKNDKSKLDHGDTHGTRTDEKT